MEEVKVVLVSMPWAPPSEPSIALGILKECLFKKGVKSKIFHTAPHLLKWLTFETYNLISKMWGVNEFLFTSVIDPSCDEQQLAILRERLTNQINENSKNKYSTVESIYELIIKLRDDIIPVYLEECAREILSYSPSIVGFSCMFDQTIASVALAKLLKQYDPSIFIVLGGYALKGTTGETIGSSFDWVDLIVQGDGEEIIVDITEKVLNNVIIEKSKNKIIHAPKIDLETSPIPDYSDWFTGIKTLYETDKIKINTRVLPVESSRGCWWGEKTHCVFCGIDEDTLKYRHKSADTTLNMLRELRKRYGTDIVYRFADYIMPKIYYTDLLSRLANEIPKYQLHSEIKANQNPERVELLFNAGFTEVQPGIESFSTGILKAMNKGVRGIENVNLLKSGYISQVIIQYNILYGMPSDIMADYEFMVENIPRLYHLTPPVARSKTVVTKFSPLQMDTQRFGFNTKVTHNRCYDVLFSQQFLENSSLNLDDYAYYFERYFLYKPDLLIKYYQLIQQIDHWKKLHRERFVELSYFVTRNNSVEITDTRFSLEDSYILTGLSARILILICKSPLNIENLKMQLIKEEKTISEKEINDSFTYLNEQRLVFTEDNLILGLPVSKEISDNYKVNKWPKSWPAIYV